MANSSEVTARAPRPRRGIARFRPWAQTAFLAVWLAPLGKALQLHRIPSCVFHCYGCPLSSLACPIGVAAGFGDLPYFALPLLVIGVLVLVGGLVGSLVCGWACPFGFLQDLAAKIPTPKFRIPGWMGYGRYVVLIGLVILVPYLWGKTHPLYICNVCPAGALEAGVYNMAKQAVLGGPVEWMRARKFVILGVLLVAMLFTYRPWCKVLCPLGGLLALFNRFSIFHLRFKAEECRECNLCRSRCSMGVKVEKRVNTADCIRCLECTTCGAISPAAGRRTNQSSPKRKSPPARARST